jgi:hypothetical protein
LMILMLVMECLVAFLVGYAMATYGAGCRFVVLFSLFALLLAYCFDPYVFSYFREDQAWLIVSNAAVVLYFVAGWLFYIPEEDPETSAKHGLVRKNGKQKV